MIRVATLPPSKELRERSLAPLSHKKTLLAEFYKEDVTNIGRAPCTCLRAAAEVNSVMENTGCNCIAAAVHGNTVTLGRQNRISKYLGPQKVAC